MFVKRLQEAPKVSWDTYTFVLFAADIGAWEAEKTAAKEEKRKRLWENPNWQDYNPVLRARLKKSADEDEDSENGSQMLTDNFQVLHQKSTFVEEKECVGSMDMAWEWLRDSGVHWKPAKACDHPNTFNAI
ncbi:hypothetical protein DFH08DRAFT_811466 [Mycena albidolilacea]|uniref:Uncharacterized protein n=1 Tax=Mycena albidolilacea TaxID=1033008 RepID=A0AAD6ZVC9_9AGAR|nr:hypothetical protein DFH08DRAFT_811466 [Mycena albidolilacea]